MEEWPHVIQVFRGLKEAVYPQAGHSTSSQRLHKCWRFLLVDMPLSTQRLAEARAIPGGETTGPNDQKHRFNTER